MYLTHLKDSEQASAWALPSSIHPTVHLVHHEHAPLQGKGMYLTSEMRLDRKETTSWGWKLALGWEVALEEP